MIAARFRFHGRGGLHNLHRNASLYRSRYFVVKVIPTPQRSYSRYAVIVSKKVHKSAVGRNRIRRRVYELIRSELGHVPIAHDIAVVVVSGEALAATHDDLKSTLSGIYEQAKLR